jgi:hypothetical protein
MNLGDLATVEQGDVRLLSISFAKLLQAGETLTAPATATMALWPYSPTNDPNAPNLVLGSAAISGVNVAVLCGGYGTAGFRAGAVYSLWVTVATSLGETLQAYGQITCDRLVPPTQSSGGTLPDNTIEVTEDITAAASALYVFTAPGKTLSLPTQWAPNGGIVTALDVAAVGGTVAGNVINWPNGTTSMKLVPGGAMSFAFSTQLNGWLTI